MRLLLCHAFVVTSDIGYLGAIAVHPTVDLRPPMMIVDHMSCVLVLLTSQLTHAVVHVNAAITLLPACPHACPRIAFLSARPPFAGLQVHRHTRLRARCHQPGLEDVDQDWL